MKRYVSLVIGGTIAGTANTIGKLKEKQMPKNANYCALEGHKAKIGVYFRDENHWCGKGCWKRAKKAKEKKVNA